MSKRIIRQYLTAEGVRVTICKPNPAPKLRIVGSRHLGKSDSAVARATGRHNHA